MKYLLRTIKQNFIYRRLTEIKNKPGLWLKKKSLSYLECYISAYIDGYLTNNKNESIKWFMDFKKYICQICVAGNECYGPVNAILECGYSDESGFDYYYELLDSFIQEKGFGEDYKEKKAESYLKEEIKIYRMDEEMIYQMASRYISEHKEELFDLPQKDIDSIGEYVLYSLFKNKEIISAIYDPRYVKFNVVEHKLKSLK